MTVPNPKPKPEDILSMPADDIVAFIRSHTQAKTLSHMVRRLNNDLIDGDDASKVLAAKALHHLGFQEDRG